MQGGEWAETSLIVETIPGLIAVMTPAGEVEHVNGQPKALLSLPEGLTWVHSTVGVAPWRIC